MFTVLTALARAHINTLGHARRARRTATRAAQPGADAGLSTLELVIVALGLMALAGLLVAALTVAVRSRINQIQ